MQPRLVIGADPGITGALAFLDIDAAGKMKMSFMDMPLREIKGSKTRNEIDEAALADALATRLMFAPAAVHAFVERVSAMPGQGVTSMFRFGYAAGVLRGVLAATRVPITPLAPQEWRRRTRTPAGKDGARQRAGMLFPDAAASFARVKDHGRADAALIAYAGASL